MVVRMSDTIPVEKQTLDALLEENHLLKQLINELKGIKTRNKTPQRAD